MATNKEKKVIDYFLKNQNNTYKVLSKKFKIKPAEVSKIIDNYFKNPPLPKIVKEKDADFLIFESKMNNE